MARTGHALGNLRRLEPLDATHLNGLVEASKTVSLETLVYDRSETGRDGGRDRATPRAPARRFDAAVYVFDGAGRVAGMTTYMNVNTGNRRVEIGSTWYRAGCGVLRSTPRRNCCCSNTPSNVLIASRSNSERRASTFEPAAIQRLGAIWTACCATTPSTKTDRCATRTSTASRRRMAEITSRLRRELDRPR